MGDGRVVGGCGGVQRSGWLRACWLLAWAAGWVVWSVPAWGQAWGEWPMVEGVPRLLQGMAGVEPAGPPWPAGPLGDAAERLLGGYLETLQPGRLGPTRWELEGYAEAAGLGSGEFFLLVDLISLVEQEPASATLLVAAVNRFGVLMQPLGQPGESGDAVPGERSAEGQRSSLLRVQHVAVLLERLEGSAGAQDMELRVLRGLSRGYAALLNDLPDAPAPADPGLLRVRGLLAYVRAELAAGGGEPSSLLRLRTFVRQVLLPAVHGPGVDATVRAEAVELYLAVSGMDERAAPGGEGASNPWEVAEGGAAGAGSPEAGLSADEAAAKLAELDRLAIEHAGDAGRLYETQRGRPALLKAAGRGADELLSCAAGLLAVAPLERTSDALGLVVEHLGGHGSFDVRMPARLRAQVYLASDPQRRLSLTRAGPVVLAEIPADEARFVRLLEGLAAEQRRAGRPARVNLLLLTGQREVAGAELSAMGDAGFAALTRRRLQRVGWVEAGGAGGAASRPAAEAADRERRAAGASARPRGRQGQRKGGLGGYPVVRGLIGSLDAVVPGRADGADIMAGIPLPPSLQGPVASTGDRLVHSPAVQSVLRQLAALRSARAMRQAEIAGLLAACAAAVVWSVLPLLAGMVELPFWQRLLLGLGLVAGPLLVLVGTLAYYRWTRPSDLDLALLAERRLGTLESRLVNVLQLAQDGFYDPVLRHRAVTEAAHAAAGVDLTPAARIAARAVLLRVAAVLAVAAAGLVGSLHQTWWTGLMSLVGMQEVVQRSGLVPIVEVLPGDVEAEHGAGLTIQCRLGNDEALPVQVTLFFREEGGELQSVRMAASGDGRSAFSHAVDAVLRPFSYWIEAEPATAAAAVVAAGRSRSAVYRVTVQPPPALTRSELSIRPPAYTGLGPRSVSSPAGRIEAPQGSRVGLLARMSGPCEARLVVGGQRVAVEGSDGGRQFAHAFTVAADTALALQMLDARGRSLAQIPASGQTLEVVSVVDQPPSLRMVRPGQSQPIAQGQSITIELSGSDDYALTRMQIVYALAADQPGVPIATTPAGFAYQRLGRAVLAHQWTIDARQFPAGSQIWLWGEATDNRALPVDLPDHGPQTARTQPLCLTVLSPDQAVDTARQALEQLRTALQAILQVQVSARADAVRAAHSTDAARRAQLHTDLRRQQQAVIDQTRGLLDGFAWIDSLAEIRQSLAMLAAGPMPNAVRHAALLPDARGSAYGMIHADLLAAQREVIDLLGLLLGLLPDAAAQSLTDPLSRPGSDVPPDQIEKLRELQKKLEDFAQAQRTLVSALAPLAKKPVDDYTEEDKLRLEELKQAMADWDKFIEQAIADFSKMPEQDFANASLVAELIEIREDVVMANDGLERKATEIATDAAAAGGELAEEITCNLERWLPNVPDREKWAMQDPSDGQLNIPMPELPKELEDIVGDLLEQEEDLFDEMQDVTSKAADALDKGAGWDALDGPIANMTAKGVTGNQLPNDSEMQGRSGEGRSGKATGEMVEESADGKGGRRTPTRLSPDPFQAGQVQDSGKQDAGGATGGGKVSGQGEEGLEGPLPPSLQAELDVLRQKQAAIRNQAERVAAGFEVSGVERMRLNQAIAIMSRIEQDLAEHRYQNALRRRDVLFSSLRSLQQISAGRASVREDTTPTLPQRVRQNIADSRQAPPPRGFEDLAGAYFDQLSQDP